MTNLKLMSNADITALSGVGEVLTEGMYKVRDLPQQAELFHRPT